jgi:hypothetical protein
MSRRRNLSKLLSLRFLPLTSNSNVSMKINSMWFCNSNIRKAHHSSRKLGSEVRETSSENGHTKSLEIKEESHLKRKRER